MQRLVERYVGQLAAVFATEGAAAGGKQYLVEWAGLADKALEYGRVFAVDGQYRCPVEGGGAGHYLAGHHHGFLVGQCYSLAALQGAQGGS